MGNEFFNGMLVLFWIGTLGLVITLTAELYQRDGKIVEGRSRLKRFFANREIKENPGFIYILRRSDGIIKIGKSYRVEGRMIQLEKEYKKGVSLLKRFTVEDVTLYEKLALSMTRDYIYDDEEGRELRKMSEKEVSKFIEKFSVICNLANASS